MTESATRLGRRLRTGCARAALLAAVSVALGCGSADDGAAPAADESLQSVEPPVPATTPEPIADPIEAFVDLARQSGEDERTIAIARCTITQVQEQNGRDIAEALVRAKRAEIANQPLPPEALPAFGVMLQEAQDCAERYDTESAKK